MIKKSRRKHDPTLKEKVTDMYETNKDTMSFQYLDRHFNIAVSTVKSMWQSRSKLQSAADSNLSKMRTCHFPAQEEELIKLIRLAREHRVPVTRSIILSKAAQL